MLQKCKSISEVRKLGSTIIMFEQSCIPRLFRILQQLEFVSLLFGEVRPRRSPIDLQNSSSHCEASSRNCKITSWALFETRSRQTNLQSGLSLLNCASVPLAACKLFGSSTDTVCSASAHYLHRNLHSTFATGAKNPIRSSITSIEDVPSSEHKIVPAMPSEQLARMDLHCCSTTLCG